MFNHRNFAKVEKHRSNSNSDFFCRNPLKLNVFHQTRKKIDMKTQDGPNKLKAGILKKNEKEIVRK